MPSYASYPGPSLDNPFQIPWALAMEEHGWQVCSPVWWPGSLIRNRKRIPILLFHWPESYWRSNKLWKTQIAALRFRCMVRLAKALGYKLVWSAHNVMPHDHLSERVERLMRSWILANFDLVLGHAHNTLADLEQEFGPVTTQYLEAVHGHYEGLFCPSADTASLLRKFDLSPEKQKVLLILSGKKYKGQLQFLQAWGARKWEHLQLVVAGRVPVDFRVTLERLQGDVRHIGASGVPHNTLADLINCCDMLALPYRRITTSGAYFLALTCRKPVIAPDLPFFTLHSKPSSALLYGGDHSVSVIADALGRLDRREWAPNLQSLIDLRGQYTWARSAARVAEAFDHLAGEKP